MELFMVIIIVVGIAALGWGILKMLNQREAGLPNTVADLKVKESSVEVKKPRTNAKDSKGKAPAAVPSTRKNTTVKKTRNKKVAN